MPLRNFILTARPKQHQPIFMLNVRVKKLLLCNGLVFLFFFLNVMQSLLNPFLSPCLPFLCERIFLPLTYHSKEYVV